MAADLLVKLYDIKEDPALLERLAADGVSIRRAIPANLHDVTEFAEKHFQRAWAGECQVAFAHDGCFIAVREHQLIGFACVEVMKDYFGPTGVLEDERGKGIGTALLLRALTAMRERGYAYAIIGYVDDALAFYQKTVGAIEIPDSIPGHFGNMLKF